jgi:hypothetical protein
MPDVTGGAVVDSVPCRAWPRSSSMGCKGSALAPACLDRPSSGRTGFRRDEQGIYVATASTSFARDSADGASGSVEAADAVDGVLASKSVVRDGFWFQQGIHREVSLLCLLLSPILGLVGLLGLLGLLGFVGLLGSFPVQELTADRP